MYTLNENLKTESRKWRNICQLFLSGAQSLLIILILCPTTIEIFPFIGIKMQMWLLVIG